MVINGFVEGFSWLVVSENGDIREDEVQSFTEAVKLSTLNGEVFVVSKVERFESEARRYYFSNSFMLDSDGSLGLMVRRKKNEDEWDFPTEVKLQDLVKEDQAVYFSSYDKPLSYVGFTHSVPLGRRTLLRVVLGRVDVQPRVALAELSGKNPLFRCTPANGFLLARGC